MLFSLISEKFPATPELSKWEIGLVSEALIEESD